MARPIGASRPPKSSRRRTARTREAFARRLVSTSEFYARERPWFRAFASADAPKLDLVRRTMVNDDLEHRRSTRLRAYAISQALAQLASAAKIDNDRAIIARREALKAAAGAVKASAAEAGLSATTADFIMAKILGVGP